MNDTIAQSLSKEFSTLSRRPSEDCWAFNIHESEYLPLLKILKNQYHFSLLADLTAVDWQESSPRYSVICHLLSIEEATYLRIVCDCLSIDKPSMPSLSNIYPAAEWHEREVYDMFGIFFSKHPNLKRILMWDTYPYHPLRKEFPLAGIPTDLPASDVAEQTQARVIAAPMMGGPFHAGIGNPISHNEPQAADQSWSETNPKPHDA